MKPRLVDQPLATRAPAKINLTLHVLGRRADGYHDLESFVAFAGVADTLSLVPGQNLSLLLEGPTAAGAGPPEDNLVLRAARNLRERVGGLRAGEFRLIKRLPVAAGIGGGSADAAAALVGLDRLFGLGLDDAGLRKAGLRIGADVPFCLAGGTALGEGIGEILTPLPAPPPHALVVAKPEAGADTGAIYRAHDERPGTIRPSVAPTVEALRAGDLGALARSLGNDLAPVTRALVPGVGELEEALSRAGALGVAMSGTGTAVYGVFRSVSEAREAARRLPADHFVAVCRPVGRGLRLHRR